MAKGAPDYDNVRVLGPLHRLDDLAELAVRLGSIVSFDRRGSVVWLDNFNDGIGQWNGESSGTNSAIDVSAEHVRSGAYSAKITCGPEDESFCRLERWFPYPVPGNIGFEISFSVHCDTDRIHVGIVGADGTDYFIGAVRYYVEEHELRFQASPTTWTTFATDVALKEYDYFLHTAKLVIDVISGKYVRFIMDAHEYDLSSYDYSSIEWTQTPHMFAYIHVWNEKDLTCVNHVDDAILTQNEP